MPLTIFAKSSILDVCLVLEDASSITSRSRRAKSAKQDLDFQGNFNKDFIQNF